MQRSLVSALYGNIGLNRTPYSKSSNGAQRKHASVHIFIAKMFIFDYFGQIETNDLKLVLFRVSWKTLSCLLTTKTR